MELSKIEKTVLKYSAIPDEVKKHHWISEHKKHAYVEVHIDNDGTDPLTDWILENYPELKRKISFFIHIDTNIYDRKRKSI
jgi:hypothetical protein